MYPEVLIIPDKFDIFIYLFIYLTPPSSRRLNEESIINPALTLLNKNPIMIPPAEPSVVWLYLQHDVVNRGHLYPLRAFFLFQR